MENSGSVQELWMAGVKGWGEGGKECFYFLFFWFCF